jgi:hypothetical protein
MHDRAVCFHHGGKTPRGLASPHFKTGRYSKDIPTRLLANYTAALADPDLLALRSDIALVDSRLGELLARVDSGESGAIWRTLRGVWANLITARAKGDIPGMQEHLSEVGVLIERGLADYAAWMDIQKCLEQRRKLTESEWKRLVDMQQMITTEKAMVLLAAVVDVIRKEVSDRDTLGRISIGIAGLVANSAGRRTESE